MRASGSSVADIARTTVRGAISASLIYYSNAATIRHTHIDEYEVGPMPSDKRDAVDDAERATNETQCGLVGEEQAERLHQRRVVVKHRYTDRRPVG